MNAQSLPNNMKCRFLILRSLNALVNFTHFNLPKDHKIYLNIEIFSLVDECIWLFVNVNLSLFLFCIKNCNHWYIILYSHYCFIFNMVFDKILNFRTNSRHTYNVNKMWLKVMYWIIRHITSYMDLIFWWLIVRDSSPWNTEVLAYVNVRQLKSN